MRPFPIGPDTPYRLEGVEADWDRLITGVAALDTARDPYLAALRRYSNDCREERSCGVLAVEAEHRADAGVDRLLAICHAVPALHAPLLARLVACVHRAGPLFGVPETPEAIEASLAAPPAHPLLRTELVHPFLVEGTLAHRVYHYGMVRHFWDDHSPAEARELARGFVRARLRDDLDTTVALTTIAAWSSWFDPHSCSDWSVILLDRRERRITLLGSPAGLVGA